MIPSPTKQVRLVNHANTVTLLSSRVTYGNVDEVLLYLLRAVAGEDAEWMP